MNLKNEESTWVKTTLTDSLETSLLNKLNSHAAIEVDKSNEMLEEFLHHVISYLGSFISDDEAQRISPSIIFGEFGFNHYQCSILNK